MTGADDVVAELTRVRFGYDKARQVVTDVDLRIESSVVHALTGPSGCGKSTLLYLLGLLLRPATGNVVVGGARVSAMTDRQRSRVRATAIGFVFQDALLEPTMTVWENLQEAMPARFDRRAARVRAAAMLDAMALDPALLDRRAISMSGGQAQRIAVVRALLKGPRLVLADEPTGNLDDNSGALVLDTLFDYGRRPGNACVIVTHDQRIAQRADCVTTFQEAS